MGIGRDEPLTPFFVGDAVEDRVERQQRIAGKVHLRDQPREEIHPEQRKMDVLRPPGIVMIAPGIRPRLDRREAVFAVGVGQCAPRTDEVGIERRMMLIIDMDIAPAGVGLPDFDQRVRHRAVVFVKHAPGDDDPFAERFAVLDGVARQVVVERLELIIAVNRSRSVPRASAADEAAGAAAHA